MIGLGSGQIGWVYVLATKQKMSTTTMDMSQLRPLIHAAKSAALCPHKTTKPRKELTSKMGGCYLYCTNTNRSTHAVTRC